jgi:hypothetical protein
MELYYEVGIIISWNHTIGIIPRRWNHYKEMESYHGIIPRRWDHTMESFQEHGIIPWNHPKNMESYHGIIPKQNHTIPYTEIFLQHSYLKTSLFKIITCNLHVNKGGETYNI